MEANTIVHGANRYRKGCRCEVCKAAQRIRSRRAYLKKKGIVDPSLAPIPSAPKIRHGRSRYKKGCRCDLCMQSMRDREARRRARRRARLGLAPRVTLSPQERKDKHYRSGRERAWLQQKILRNGAPFRYADYESMYESQGGKCQICGCEIGMSHGNLRSLSACVDHNAKTGEARSLLCARCNHMIGNSLERAEVLEAGAAYLRGRA
jgi:hypothetical protein